MAWYTKTLKAYFTPDELRDLTELSDGRGLWEVVKNWAWIAAAMALVALWPATLPGWTIIAPVVLALFIIGGKQLGCAIIMHDAGHNALFKTPQLNEFFGTWFGAAPILLDLPRYRTYHLRHHRHTGLETDPDKGLTTGYPTTRASMVRKVLRDLTGLTGLKGQLGVLAMHAGLIEFELGGRVHRIDQTGRSTWDVVRTFARSFWKPLVAQLVLVGVLWAIGQPLLYLLWIGALLTTYNFSLRVRSIAEHSVVADREDPLVNTRTTRANPIEHLLFAPLNVNYHAEHHLLMSAPCYKLPEMHRMLRERGYYRDATYAPGYWFVVRQAMSAPVSTR